MEYLLKVSVVIAIFYFSYKLFLQRDTFFESNRWFLLLGLFTAFFIPFIIIPEYVEYTPVSLTNYNFNNIVIQNTENTFSLLDFLFSAYLIGLIFFSIRFLVQTTSLFKLVFKNKSYRNKNYNFVETNNNVSPFSFFNWIVYNPNQFSKTELNQIIEHEKVHVKQYHSIDVLLTQMACILLWFNPLIWLYNKDLKQNLEFIADHNAINYSSCKKAYQYTLLKTSLSTHQLALSNHFYNSLIKKRIVMLHKSKSKKINQIKFTLVLPFLVIFLMSFNTEKVYLEKETPINKTLDFKSKIEVNNTTSALNNVLIKPINEKEINKIPNETKKQNNNVVSLNNKEFMAIVTKETSDTDLDKIVEKFKKIDVTLKFKGVKRNKKGEIIAIKIDAKSKNSNSNYNLSSDDAIKPIKISFNQENDSISIGNTTSNSKTIFAISNTNDGKPDKIYTTTNSNSNFYVTTDTNVETEIETEVETEVDVIKLNEENSKNNKTKIIISKTNNNEPIHIINGKVVKKNEIEELEVENINKVEVLKGDDAVKKYGNKGKDGVVMVTTKDKNNDTIIISTDDDKKPLYIIDGKEDNNDKLEVLNPDNIHHIKVLKGDDAIKKYGDKGSNGVIEVTTKKKN